MSKKTWKDHLLSSGVPLEYSVIRIFEELGIRDAGEYRYERKTADGVAQVFSVDVHAKKIDSHRGLNIECLVECEDFCGDDPKPFRSHVSSRSQHSAFQLAKYPLTELVYRQENPHDSWRAPAAPRS